MTTFRQAYKDHVLSCSTTLQTDGKFGAHVAVIYLKGDRTTSQRFLDIPEAFADENEARDRAFALGMEWIDTDAAKRPPSSFRPGKRTLDDRA